MRGRGSNGDRAGGDVDGGKVAPWRWRQFQDSKILTTTQQGTMVMVMVMEVVMEVNVMVMVIVFVEELAVASVSRFLDSYDNAAGDSGDGNGDGGEDGGECDDDGDITMMVIVLAEEGWRHHQFQDSSILTTTQLETVVMAMEMEVRMEVNVTAMVNVFVEEGVELASVSRFINSYDNPNGEAEKATGGSGTASTPVGGRACERAGVRACVSACLRA